MYSKFTNALFKLKPSTHIGVSVKENVVPSAHVTVLSPVRVYPALHFRDTSLPGGRGNCVSVFISLQLSGSPSHDSGIYLC